MPSDGVKSQIILNKLFYYKEEKVTISEAKDKVRSIVKNNLKLPVMLWGPPGIGKSAIIRQITEELKMGFIDLRLSLFGKSQKTPIFANIRNF